MIKLRTHEDNVREHKQRMHMILFREKDDIAMMEYRQSKLDAEHKAGKYLTYEENQELLKADQRAIELWLESNEIEYLPYIRPEGV